MMTLTFVTQLNWPLRKFDSYILNAPPGRIEGVINELKCLAILINP